MLTNLQSQNFRFKKDLLRHGIKIGEDTNHPDVDLKLPPLRGKNIEEHFYEIAQEQVKSYQTLIASLVSNEIPEMPKVSFQRSPITYCID